MDVLVAAEVVAVLTAWGFLLLSVRRWGPGRRKRSVRCPEKKHAEPRGTCHGALVPLFHPVVCLRSAGRCRRAQRQINIVKLTYTPVER